MAQKGEKYVLSLRRHLVSAPGYEVTVTISIVVILLASYLVYWDLWKALIIFALPYVLVNLMDYALIRAIRIYFPGKRIITLNLLVFCGVFIQILIFRIFFSFMFSLMLAFSSAVFLRTLIYLVFMRNRPAMGIIASMNYNAIYCVIAILLTPQHIISYVMASFIYLLVALLTLKISVTRFIREFSEDPMFFISSLINYFSSKEKEHVHSLNRFFEKIYVRRKVPVSSMVFWKDNTPKAIFLFPYIHPGPFGEVGGSDITRKLKKFTGLENLMVFHTTTTHDNNVADDRDVKKIANVVRRSLESDKKYSTMSDLARFKIDGFETMAQIFGKYAFVSLIPKKYIFDDVDLESGLALRKKLLKFYEDAGLVDAHNNFDENAFPLTLKHKDVEYLAKKIFQMKADTPIIMGYSQSIFNGKSFGPDGIKVAIFIYKNKKIGYILLDGNNIKKGLRNKIRSEMRDILDEVEVFSTDNHIVNYSFLDLNPVGDKEDWYEIVSRIKETVKNAIANAERVDVSMHTETVELRMARSGQLRAMTEIARDTLRRAKIYMPTLIIGGFLGALISFLYL